MRNVFLKMATRMNWRVLVTVVGVAACVMYLTGTTSMVEGLQAGTQGLAAQVNQGPYLIHEGDSLTTSSIERDIVLELEGDVTACWVLEVAVLAQYAFVDDTYVVACEDPDDQLGLDLRNFTQERIWIGLALKQKILDRNLSASWGSLITLEYGSENITLPIVRILGWSVFSEEWAVVPQDILLNLSQDQEKELSFLLVPRESKGDISHLESLGYHAIPTTGTVKFFEMGIEQVEQDLWGIVFSSALVITILVFSLLGIEVRSRERDIKILNQIGGGRGLVMGIFLTQALFISIFGALLGVSMGVIATNFITSWSSLFGYASFITPQITFNSVGVPIIMALAFGLIGGAIPAYTASTLRRRKEVSESS